MDWRIRGIRAIRRMITNRFLGKGELRAQWVARFGSPHTIKIDWGTQFTSSTWNCVCRTIGADHILATAYQPQSNVMVERYHRQLKEALRAHGCGSAGLAAPQEDSGFSAAETLYEVRLLSPGQPQKKPESFAPGAPPPDTSPELYR